MERATLWFQSWTCRLNTWNLFTKANFGSVKLSIRQVAVVFNKGSTKVKIVLQTVGTHDSWDVGLGVHASYAKLQYADSILGPILAPALVIVLPAFRRFFGKFLGVLLIGTATPNIDRFLLSSLWNLAIKTISKRYKCNCFYFCTVLIIFLLVKMFSSYCKSAKPWQWRILIIPNFRSNNGYILTINLHLCILAHMHAQSFRLSERMMGPWAHRLGKWWAHFQIHGSFLDIYIYYIFET